MLEFLKIPTIRNLLIIAIIIRLLLMPFFFHPDIKTYSYQVSHLKDGVFNIYQYISENKGKLPIRDDFTYFPLTYFVLGGYQAVSSPLLGENFPAWVSDASGQSLEKIGVFRYLSILKGLYLFFDITIAFVLINFFKDYRQKKKIFTIWLFNPFSLVLIYVYSGIDILPVLFMVVSLLLLHNKKILLAALLMGIAAAFKGYTLIFLPFFFLFGKNLKQKFLIILSFLAPFLISIFPFLFTQGFKEQALVSGLTNRIFFTSISLGFGEALMVTVFLIAFLFFWAILKKDKISTWHYLSALLLILFSTIHYHVQWLLWILPFVIMLSVFYENLSKLVFIWLTLAFIIPLLYNDKSMTVSLYSAISPLYNLLPTFSTAVQKIYDPFVIQSIIHSSMLALSLIIIWQLFEVEKNE